MTTEARTSKLGAHTAEIKADARRHKNQIVTDIEDAANDARGHVREFAREVGERAQDFIVHKREQIEDVRDTAERTIREKPFVSTGTMFLGGLLLGMLLKR